MHERIDLVRAVIAGEHRLTIRLPRDIDSAVERGIVFIWRPAPMWYSRPQRSATPLSLRWLRRGSSSQRSELANCEQHRSMPGGGSARPAPAEIGTARPVDLSGQPQPDQADRSVSE